MQGKQAKIVSPTQERAILGYLDTTRYPYRDRVMFLLSMKAGLRAKEIASLTWAMVTDAAGQVAEAIHVPNRASKGKTGGRTIPLHPDLQAALVALQIWRGDMATPERLAKECAQLVGYGASAVGIFDSAGNYLPDDVTERITAIRAAVDVPVAFHGHNNLGMAVANSLAAVEAGATTLDACARGFGAGAGNTQLEVLVPVHEQRPARVVDLVTRGDIDVLQRLGHVEQPSDVHLEAEAPPQAAEDQQVVDEARHLLMPSRRARGAG